MDPEHAHPQDRQKPAQSAFPPQEESGPTRPGLGGPIAITLGLLLLVFVASLCTGNKPVSPSRAITALLNGADSTEPVDVIVRTSRLPRSLLAIMVGGALALAGGVTQALTRNPLGSPSVLGINHGASLAVVVTATFAAGGNWSQTGAAFAGATAAGALVLLITAGGRGTQSVRPPANLSGDTSTDLAVAGFTLGTLFASIVQMILVLNEESLEASRRWLAGSVGDVPTSVLWPTLPFILVGTAIACSLARPLSLLATGEEVAQALGQHSTRVKSLASLSVVLLAGSAVAAAGPISFVGFAVPHAARRLVSSQNPWSLPFTALCGAVFLLLADIFARVALHPRELPVGIMTALVGGPVFIIIARREKTPR